MQIFLKFVSEISFYIISEKTFKRGIKDIQMPQ